MLYIIARNQYLNDKTLIIIDKILKSYIKFRIFDAKFFNKLIFVIS